MTDSKYSGRAIALLAFLPFMLTGLKAQDRAVPLKNWAAPLYWQFNQGEREASIESHCDQRGFSESRDALNAHVFRVDHRISLEVIESARCTPGPGAQSTPLVRLSRLSMVHQSDDAARESGAIIRLRAGRIEECVAPPRAK